VRIYPPVAGEFDTIRALLTGKSLARFGDGELKMAHGSGYSRQTGSAKLAAELCGILRFPPRGCVVGIPTMDPQGPKYQNWLRHRDRFLNVLSPKVRYASAFVTRPDSAPWIECREFCELMVRLWKGKRTAVLCEANGSMWRAVSPEAGEPIHVEAPHYGAYDNIDRLELEILATRPEVVILSAGPAATCLAARFSRVGIQAVDLGSVGAMVVRTLYPK
jgi:hypothetical protein